MAFRTQKEKNAYRAGLIAKSRESTYSGRTRRRKSGKRKRNSY